MEQLGEIWFFILSGFVFCILMYYFKEYMKQQRKIKQSKHSKWL